MNKHWSFLLGFFIGFIVAFAVIRLGKGMPNDVCNMDCAGRDYSGGTFSRDLQRCVCFTTTSASNKELDEMWKRR